MTEIRREGVDLTLREAQSWMEDQRDCPAGGACDACVTRATTIALCEQWLKARRAQWNDYDAEHATLDTDTRTVGSVVDRCEYEDEGSTWFAYYDGELVGVDDGYDTKAEAQAVVESLAIADGYEIAREP